MWPLMGMLPLILLDTKPQIEGLSHFQNYIKMLEIINITFAYEISDCCNCCEQITIIIMK